jgi:hypothetical protein
MKKNSEVLYQQFGLTVANSMGILLLKFGLKPLIRNNTDTYPLVVD